MFVVIYKTCEFLVFFENVNVCVTSKVLQQTVPQLRSLYAEGMSAIALHLAKDKQ